MGCDNPTTFHNFSCLGYRIVRIVADKLTIPDRQMLDNFWLPTIIQLSGDGHPFEGMEYLALPG